MMKFGKEIIIIKTIKGVILFELLYITVNFIRRLI